MPGIQGSGRECSCTSCGVKDFTGSSRGSMPTGPPGGGTILGRLSGAGQLHATYVYKSSGWGPVPQLIEPYRSI